MSTEQTINDIAVKVGRLEAMQEGNTRAIGDMAVSVNRLVEKLDKSDVISREADLSARSAHHRITEVQVDIKDMKAAQRWLLGTLIGAMGLFLTAAGLLWKAAGLS